MLNALLYVPLHCWLLYAPLHCWLHSCMCRYTAGCVAVCAATLLMLLHCWLRCCCMRRCTAGCYCVPLRVTAGFAVRTVTVTVTLLLRSTVDRVGVDKQFNKR